MYEKFKLDEGDGDLFLLGTGRGGVTEDSKPFLPML